MLLGRLARRRMHGEEGTVAVMAAVIIPVLLLIVALALTSLVWGASETEVQRASDQAALDAAASEVLVPNVGLSTPSLPTLGSVLPSGNLLGIQTPLSTLIPSISTLLNGVSSTGCTQLGNAVAAAKPALNTGLLGVLVGPVLSALGIGTVSSLSSALTTLTSTAPTLAAALNSALTSPCTPITLLPAVPSAAQTAACASVARSMAESSAPYSIRFFDGSASGAAGNGRTPDCTTNHRVSVSEASQSPLLGLDANTLQVGGIGATFPGGLQTVQNLLTTLGVHLGSVIPNAICPQVSVGVDQPVKGVVFSKISTPNGRSTARRVIKNAVVVPVFNGLSLTSPTAGGGNSINLNTTVLQPLQTQLLSVLNTLDTTINNTIAAAQPVVNGLNGTLSSVNTLTGGAVPAPSVTLHSLDLLKCLTQTVGSLFNPPSGDVASVQDVLDNAAATGEPVQLIQVGVQPCAGATSAVSVYQCLLPALGGGVASVASKLTGLYDVPVLDVTPVIIKQIGNDPTNLQAIAVDATQAVGAFRAVLVRSSDNDRYAP